MLAFLFQEYKNIVDKTTVLWWDPQDCICEPIQDALFAFSLDSSCSPIQSKSTSVCSG